MPSPSVTWTDLTPAPFDQDSPSIASTWEAMRKNQVFLKEVLYGTGSFVGTVPHRHLGVEDASLIPACTGNLLNDSCPDNDAVSAWTRSGYEIESDKGFRITTTAGHYAYQIIGRQASLSKAAVGGGCDIVLALYCRAKDVTPTAGQIHFGLADGGTTFKTGCKAVIDYTQITSAHQRFYMVLDSATVGSVTTDMRFLIKNHSAAPNRILLVTAMTASIGRVLQYWQPGLLESTSTHDDWKRTGLSDCPVWDERVSLSDAIFIAGA